MPNRCDNPSSRSTGRFPIAGVAAAVVLSVALRARFIVTPLSSDEGGYLAVARSWAAGRHLYVDTWVDRPQGMLEVFRVWDTLTGGSNEAVRALAIVFGGAAVVGVAYVAFAVTGGRAATVAAVLAAVASANARIEGFIANGELLSGALVAAGVAAACVRLFRDGGRRWLFASGLLAGGALSIKQSGFDGFLAVMMCLLVMAVTGERRWRSIGRDMVSCAAGLGVVLTALALHGAALGLDVWWYAVAGYRLEGRSGLANANWDRFAETWALARPTILPLLLVVLAGAFAWSVKSRVLTPSGALLSAWVGFAALAFLTGGQFHRHYWIILAFPLAAAAGVVLAGLGVPFSYLLAALVVLPSLVSTARVVLLDRSDIPVVASGDQRSTKDEHIAEWFAAEATSPSTLYALCASAGLYAVADALPPYPYLWFDNVLDARGAQDQLESLFLGTDPPSFVAVYQPAASCNPSGVVAAALQARYEPTALVDGVTILRAREAGS